MAVALPKVDIDIEIPRDKEAERDRVMRWAVDILTSLIVLYVPYKVLQYVGGVLDHPIIGGFIGAGLGVYFLGLLMPRMLISNPEWSAYVTQDPYFGGTQIAYGPGTHPAFWWEERNVDGNYSLEVITREFTLTSPTKSSAVTVSGRLFYHASLKYLVCAIGVDKEVVEEGQVAFIQSYLVSRLGGMKAEDAIKEAKQIGKELNDTFRDVKTAAGETPEEFEKKFGYSTAVIAIDKIAYSEKVQEAFDAISEAKKTNEIAAQLLSVSKNQLKKMLVEKVITPKQVKEMVDRALVLSGNAKMQLNVIEGDVADAVANFLTQQQGKGGKS